MSKKILITGATGIIGSVLTKKLIEKNYAVSVFTRDISKAKKIIPGAFEYIKWIYEKPELWMNHLAGKDAIIHLSGANLFNKRWDKKYKKIIWESRVLSTHNIVEAIKKISNKPEVFICASGSNYYGEKYDEILTEENPPGNDFLAQLCSAWENQAAKVEKLGIRRVSMRTGAVLSTKGGALKEFLTPFRFFVGGPIGTGKQWFPWIHIEDTINVYIFALENKNLTGGVNLSAPNCVTMDEFAKRFGKVLHRPSFFKVPKIILRIVVGEVAESIVKSMRMNPEKLMENNFHFKFNNLEEALKDLLLKD